MSALPYTNDELLVPVVVRRPGGEQVLSLDFYVDTGASKTVIRGDHREELHLPFGGTIAVETGAGRIQMPAYRGDVEFSGKSFRLLLLSPRVRIRYDGLLGRDVIDFFRICFDGTAHSIEIETR